MYLDKYLTIFARLLKTQSCIRKHLIIMILWTTSLYNVVYHIRLSLYATCVEIIITRAYIIYKHEDYYAIISQLDDLRWLNYHYCSFCTIKRANDLCVSHKWPSWVYFKYTLSFEISFQMFTGQNRPICITLPRARVTIITSSRGKNLKVLLYSHSHKDIGT